MPSDIVAPTKKIIHELFKLLNISLKEISINKADDKTLQINLTVPEENSGILIGYHGETLNVLQYLLAQMINKDGKEWLKVSLNLNNYRDQREAELKQMAQNAAQRALTTGDEIEMPYLTPAERRIIHLELASRADITSFSEGEDRSRRLVISPQKKA